jgi:hypothetical protein
MTINEDPEFDSRFQDPRLDDESFRYDNDNRRRWIDFVIIMMLSLFILPPVIFIVIDFWTSLACHVFGVMCSPYHLMPW